MKQFTLTLIAIFLIGCDSPTSIPESHIETSPPATALFSFDHINTSVCDQVIARDFSTGSPLLICYNYAYKSATMVGYILKQNSVYKENISERPYFYGDQEIPEAYRIYYSDYTNSGYDRGHMAPDASFDYNQEDLEMVYTLAQIIPQNPTLNRELWADLEGYARDEAYQSGDLHVLNLILFDQNPMKLKGEADNISIPLGFYKILWREHDNFKECYYYANYLLAESSSDAVANHQVDCASIPLP